MGAPAIPDNLTDDELMQLTLVAKDEPIEADPVLVLNGKALETEPEGS